VSRGAEIDHVERAAGADIGHAGADHGAERSSPALHHPAHEKIADLGGGDVDDGGQQAGSTSFSSDWPPVPVAWKTRQSILRLERPATACTQGVVTPNMVRPIAGRAVAATGRRWATMPAKRMRAVGQHCARDAVEPGDVGDRVHHRDVGRPDIGLTSPEATVETISLGTPTASAASPG
jgi:hypothetical protein